MSHRASTWLAELPPDIINNGAFRVLFHLCDAHNSKRAAHEACFPNQSTLREVTGLSNGGLNNALNAIEQAGLMRRRRTRMPDGTKGPTYYILGCDVSIPQEPTPESGDGTNSKFGAKPSPNSGPNHLQWSGDKPVSEPVREPVKSSSSCSETRSELLTDREEILIAAGHDRSGLTATGRIVGSAGEMQQVARWRVDLGLSQAEILTVIGEVMNRKRDGPPNSLKYFTEAMQQFAATKNQPKLQTIDGGRHGKQSAGSGNRVQRIITAAARGTSRQDWG